MKFLVLISLLLVAAVGVVHSKVISERILDGENAAPHEATHMVYFRSIGSKEASGGGSLITPKWVLTCAHCTLIPLEIVVGTHNWNDLTNAQVRTIGYKDMFRHSKYALNKGPYDIGMMRVKEPFVLNEFVTIIPLATDYQLGMSTVFGFGRMTNGERPTDLQKLNTNIISYEECAPLLKDVGKLDKDSNICTWTQSRASTCAGDSGGPCVQWNGKEYWQVGIVSWGDVPCDTTENASALTKVSQYQQWISDTMKKGDAL